MRFELVIGLGMGRVMESERGRTDRGHTPSGFRFQDVYALCDERARVVDDLLGQIDSESAGDWMSLGENCDDEGEGLR